MINIVFIVLFECFSGLAFHPLHISVTNIENDTINNKLDISVKLFKNDFEAVLLKNYNTTIATDNCNFNKNDSIIISKYLNAHFSMNFVENTVRDTLQLNRIKCNDDSIWLSFVFQYKKNAGIVEFMNTFLLDLYVDQNNLMIIKNKNEEKGYQLNKNNTSIKISL